MTNYRKQLKALRSLNVDSVIPSSELTNPLDLKIGSYFLYKKDLYLVEEIGTYTEKGGFKWHELECYNISQDKKVYIELENDDELEMYITLKEIKMSELNKTADQIEDISEEESGSVRYNGSSYEYDDDYGAEWERNGEKYKVYFYDFVKGKECLTVEEWKIAKGEYEYKAYLSKEIYPEDIRIISL